jgi:tRNA(Ile)-lysidine synthase
MKKGTVPFSAAVEAALAQRLPAWPEARLCVALSGGVDSVALLHACHALAATHRPLELRAIHVHHGLQAEADGWQQRCEDLCSRLEVPLEVVQLALEPRHGHSVEAEARDARYRALAERLAPGEVLLTAHHQDDQLETVLLQLMRGAGVAGLSAMPAQAPFGPGLHLRPLLGMTRAEMEAQTRAAGLDCVEDPMNSLQRFGRAYLRQQVLPALRARWPAAGGSVARSARHLAEAQGLLQALAEMDGRSLLDHAGCLSVAGLLALPRPRQANVLRWWIGQQGLGMPSTSRLDSILHNVLPARADARPVVTWRTGEIRRYRGLLHAMRPLQSLPAGSWTLAIGQTLEIEAVGKLALQRVIGAGLAASDLSGPVEVRLPAGDERLQPAGQGREVLVKDLFRQVHLEPWLRSRIPMVYCGGRLLAVGDRWIAAGSAATGHEAGYVIHWTRCA